MSLIWGFDQVYSAWVSDENYLDLIILDGVYHLNENYWLSENKSTLIHPLAFIELEA